MVLNARHASCLWLLVAAAFLLLPTAAGAQSEWEPGRETPGEWTLGEHDVAIASVPVSRDKTCDVRQSVWVLSSEQVAVTVKAASCGDDATAALYSWEARAAAKRIEGTAVLGPDVDWTFHPTFTNGPGIGYGRMWAQSSFTRTVIIACGKWSMEKCRELNEKLSVSLANASSGTPAGPAINPSSVLSAAFISYPVLVWATVVGLPGLGRWLARSRYQTPNPAHRWVDVDQSASRLRRRSVLWGTAVGIQRVTVTLAALYLVAFVSSPTISFAIGFLVVTTVAIASRPLRRRLANPIFSGSLLPREMRNRHLQGWLGLALRALVRILLVPLTVLYLWVVFLSYIGGTSSLTLDRGLRALDDKISRGEASLADYFRYYTGLFSDSPELFFVILLLVVIAALAIDRLGIRLLMRNARQVMTTDGRRPILYLRHFGDDKLRLRASRISRRGLLGRLSPRHTRRFEEVVAWRLNRFGPLIAVNDPRTRLAKLGAAKMSLAHHNWQDDVERLASQSLAVAVSAAPQAINPGLQWELEMLATRLPHGRIVLIVPPHKKRRLLDGWRRFTAATASFPIFQQIGTINHTGAAQVLVHISGEGWWAWGATSRSEWTYATAVHLAMEYAMSRWAKPEPDEPTSASMAA